MGEKPQKGDITRSNYTRGVWSNIFELGLSLPYRQAFCWITVIYWNWDIHTLQKSKKKWENNSHSAKPSL